MPDFAVGVDLGGTNMRIAAVDETGKQLEVISTSTEVKRGRESVVTDMCDAIRAVSAKFSSGYRLIGTGIGVPGIIDLEYGLVKGAHKLTDLTKYSMRVE